MTLITILKFHFKLSNGKSKSLMSIMLVTEDVSAECEQHYVMKITKLRTEISRRLSKDQDQREKMVRETERHKRIIHVFKNAAITIIMN